MHYTSLSVFANRSEEWGIHGLGTRNEGCNLMFRIVQVGWQFFSALPKILTREAADKEGRYLDANWSAF